MSATLQDVNKMLDSAVSDLLNLPHDLPSECRIMLAKARLASEDPALIQAAATFLRDSTGQALRPQLETLDQIRRQFQSAREDVFPSRNRYLANEAGVSPFSDAPIWNQRGSLEDVLCDSGPTCLHPLAKPLEVFAMAAFDAALAQALKQDVDLDILRSFAGSARNLSPRGSQLSEEAARQLIDQAKQIMRTDLLDQLEINEQNIVRTASMVESLQQRANALFGTGDIPASEVLRDLRAKGTALDVKEWAGGMVSLRNTLRDISEKQEEPLVRLADKQQEIRAYADGISQRVEEARNATSKAFGSATKLINSAASVVETAYHEGQTMLAQAQQAGEFVQAFGAGRVSTSDLLGMLELPSVPLIPELEALKAPLRTVQLLQEGAAGQLSDLFQGSESLLSAGAELVSKQLGLAPSSVAITQAAVGIAEAVATGNVFAAVGLLAGGSNLLGGGGGDSALMGQLTAINAKLDQVLDNQRKMMKALDDIEKKLDILREIVIDGFKKTMVTLGTIESQLVKLQSMIEQQFDFELNQCQHYVGGSDGNSEWRLGFFGISKYEEQAKFFERENFGGAPSFASCLKGIAQIFTSSPKAPSATFLMSSHLQNGPEVDQMNKYLDELNKVFAAYLRRLPDDEAQSLKKISLLLMPPLTVDELVRKSAHDIRNVNNAVILESARLAKNALNSEALLRTDRVILAADYSMVAALIYPLLDPDNPNKLVGVEKLLDANRFSGHWNTIKGRVSGWLEDALILVNIAIAQQTVLRSECLTGAVEVFNKDPAQPVDAAISQDPLLMRNFVMLLIRGRLFEKESVARVGQVLQYSFALKQEDARQIIDLLSRTYPKLSLYKGSGRGEWFLCDDKRRESMLPSPTALDAGSFEIPPGLSQLIRKREQLIKLCAEVQVKAIVEGPIKRALSGSAIIASVLRSVTTS